MPSTAPEKIGGSYADKAAELAAFILLEPLKTPTDQQLGWFFRNISIEGLKFLPRSASSDPMSMMLSQAAFRAAATAFECKYSDPSWLLFHDSMMANGLTVISEKR